MRGLSLEGGETQTLKSGSRDPIQLKQLREAVITTLEHRALLLVL